MKNKKITKRRTNDEIDLEWMRKQILKIQKDMRGLKPFTREELITIHNIQRDVRQAKGLQDTARTIRDQIEEMIAKHKNEIAAIRNAINAIGQNEDYILQYTKVLNDRAVALLRLDRKKSMEVQ